MDDQLEREREAQRLRSEAVSCERAAYRHREDNPRYADHLQRRADHCRRLARDEEDQRY